MRSFVLIILMLAIVSCTGKWQPRDSINNGHDFLCNAGICDDSLSVADEINYNDDGKDLPHHFLDVATCEALGITKMMHVDSNTCVVRVWGLRDYPDNGVALLFGHTAYGDMRICWLATFGKDGMIDFMRLGECGGMNLSYWDDIDEHTRLIGLDSMRLVMPKKPGKPMQLSRWITLNRRQGDEENDSALWFIDHELPITLEKDGHFTVGKIGTVYSADTVLLNNYWRYKRQLEVFNWTPMSDTTLYDRVETFLIQAKGSITEPTQLLGDFNILMFTRLYSDTERFMQWCCNHPDSQLTRGTVNQLKEVNPEWVLNDLKKIKNPKVLQQARQLIGV